MQGRESVHSILEADARGEIAEIFADIRIVRGTCVVNPIWRHLATVPGALPWTWATVCPLYLGRRAARHAARSVEIVPAVCRASDPRMTGLCALIRRATRE
jgi:hypothetical protein